MMTSDEKKRKQAKSGISKGKFRNQVKLTERNEKEGIEKEKVPEERHEKAQDKAKRRRNCADTVLTDNGY
jgi:hypothetical protein